MTITWSTLTRSAIAATLLAVLPLATSGCIEDSDCGICDPDNLVLESISGVNYASRKVHLLGPTCEGSDCPGDINSGTYFIEEIGPCEETEDALESPRGTSEFCKISPLITVFGIEFVFNNLLDPTTVELVRKRPDNPQLFEVYDWKHQVLEIQGPITRYNGDFVKGGTDRPDQITRLVNLACIDNLAAEGSGFSHEDYTDPATNPCNQLGADGRPRKMWMDGTMKSYGGNFANGSNSCDTSEEGPDVCCSECDFLLSTQVAKYGLTQEAADEAEREDVADLMRNPNEILAAAAADNLVGPIPVGAYDIPGGAIVCDPNAETGDKYIQCADFIPWVSRELEERTYRYAFCADGTCDAEEHKLPYYDQLRETHPNDRPADLERQTAKCTTTTQCRSSDDHGLPGTECVGHLEDDASVACTPGATEGCIEGRCIAEWFVTCRPQLDTTGETGFCYDKRFSDDGAAACFTANAEFQVVCGEDGDSCQTASAPSGNEAGFQIAYCDHNEDGSVTSAECCQDTLGGSTLCDPFSQNVSPVSIYERNKTLPEPTRDCICPTSGSYSDVEGDPACGDAFSTCFDSDGTLRADRAGNYAVKFVDRAGGVIYDPAIKGFEFRPADTGSVPRSRIERCAEGRGLIDDRNREDGWRSNDVFLTENIEDFDRALCSGQEYTVEFNGREEGQQYVVDKADNTLDGKPTYRFETPQFHIVPGSGFPTDNLRIGACDDFSIRFSNKYDMSPENVQKVELWRIDVKDDPAVENFLPPKDGCPLGPVAGGFNCTESADEYAANNCLAPCLSVDIANVGIGEISVQIDPALFGSVLEQDSNYRVTVSGAADLASANNEVVNAAVDPRTEYEKAFWDACGMPLILGGTSEADYLYDFTVDKPKCKEDKDGDDIQLSCDNAPEVYNPNQEDVDGDGVGDVVDLCPTVPGAANNSADSDKDGVGNDCDNCQQTINQYNLSGVNPPAYMLVRNIPYQLDTDQDGIGDVCDNCVMVANCEEYGPGNPYRVGDPIEHDDETACNQDLDQNMVGNACDGVEMLEGAAGVVGLGPDDDFDQDGVSNDEDLCPRQPLIDRVTCTTDEDCPETSSCTNDVCGHLDFDGDGVGDICDTCVFAANPMQVMDGQMQADDEDGDFVGAACETKNCDNRADARPFAFYEVAANGNCCTVALVTDAETGDLIDATTGNPLLDPDGLPVRVECSEADQEAELCRKLTDQTAVTPGILTPPEGCEAALAGTEPTDNVRLTADSFDGDLVALWDNMCFLPQLDQDYDGIGDICDLCEFDFDPSNKAYIDDNGKVWPKDGKFCNGEYSIDNRCGDDEEPTGGSGGDESGGTGGDESGGGDTGGGSDG